MSDKITSVLRATSWRARVAAGVLVLALLAVSAFVWATPRIDVGDDAPSAEDLQARVDALEQDLASAEEQAERYRIEAKAAGEREQGMVSGQEKAAAERAEAEAKRLARKKAADKAAAAKLVEAQSRAGRAEARAAEAAAAGGSGSDSWSASRAGGGTGDDSDGGGSGGGGDGAALRGAWSRVGEAEAAAGEAWGSADQAWARVGDAEATAADRTAQLAEARAREKKLQQSLQGAGSGGEETPEAVSAPTKKQILRAAAGDARWWGMYTTQSPWNWAEFDNVQQKVGTDLDATVSGYFQGWDTDFRPEGVERSWRHGELPVLTWESRPMAAANDQVSEPDYTSEVVLSGRYDDYLAKYARDITRTGLPLVIRLNHEMNGDWYPWSDGVNTNQRGDYVKVWRHVHDIFEKAGANDLVIWLWAPNRVDNLAPDRASTEFLRTQYPGDEYVDWAGMSAYWRPPFREDDVPTFSSTFGATLADLRDVAAGKPLFLAEIGASEIGGQKSRWIDHLAWALTAPENDDIVGFSWFNLAVTSQVSGQTVTNDWRIDSRASTSSAFAEHMAGVGWTALPRP
ncbi:glycoside hydrolase family 26 protein [Promicromonospora sp. Marseille-Q5078]